jgi:NADH-quinone oxidoreductase subunit H
VEYSSITFALFFLGEYGSMLVLIFVITLLFLGGWTGILTSILPVGIWLILKVMLICFLFIFVRANLPRYRYDQLMSIGWKVLLPLTLGYLVFVASALFGIVLPVSIVDWVTTYWDVTSLIIIN